MLIYFPTRSKARTFAKGQKKVIDKGQASPKRWSVKII